MFDAVIFDLDGTLIDTESLYVAAGIEAFAALGHHVGPEVFHAQVGVDDHTTARMFAQDYPSLDYQHFATLWRSLSVAKQANGILLKPGATELLGALALPLALVTSSTRAQADNKLGLTGLARYFAHTITLDEVTQAKPAPEPYLLAARLLACAPARCLVFEDSETGAQAARAAGMTVVQVPDTVATTGRHAHHVATDLLAGARAFGLIPD